jgi:uncharacterized damage-inducible protein DinB
MMEKIFIDSLGKLFERDLNKLALEIKSYTDESMIWHTSGDIKNSGGNLCLHLCGNLQTYIGHELGKINYVRDRDNEFAAKNIAREKLLREIETTRSAVISTLNNLDIKLLAQDYPAKVFDYAMTTAHFLIHLQSHLNYHLGQVNYHRRLLNP